MPIVIERQDIEGSGCMIRIGSHCQLLVRAVHLLQTVIDSGRY